MGEKFLPRKKLILHNSGLVLNEILMLVCASQSIFYFFVETWRILIRRIHHEHTEPTSMYLVAVKYRV